MKKLCAMLLAALMVLSLAACEISVEDNTATDPSTELTEKYDLNEIDLDGIGELLAQRDEDTISCIQLEGLCTPVELQLMGTNLLSMTAYGITAWVEEDGAEYASIYGNLWPVIYDQNGIIFLNIWKDDIGYSCVIYPDGTYMESYPDEEYSVMIYVDEEGRMCQSQFALRFIGIEQWATGPIDMATSRDDFYYSVDDVLWTEQEYAVTARESYTISDCFELDEIFDRAKADGLYPEFDTLDELLEYNAQRFEETEEAEDSTYWPDSNREEISYLDQFYVTRDYDDLKNLISETYYDCYGGEYFTKTHTYDAQNRDISGNWCFVGEEVYRYTNEYDEQDRLTETVWYQDDAEVERFSYTYDKKGGYTETYSQKGEKKYTYGFNAQGELTAHTVYQGNKAVKTKDLKSLVKTQLLTDLWHPVIDSEPMHFSHYYDGTLPTEDPDDWTVTTAADGSRTMTRGSVDEEDGLYYGVEHRYDAQGQLLQIIYTLEGNEYSRLEYEYGEKGCIREVSYDDNQEVYTCENKYNDAGQLIRMDVRYTEPQTYYTYVTENGQEVETEVIYTERSETYRYNDQGLLVETVVLEDGNETDRTSYDYDANGYLLPRLSTYEYTYNAEGVLEQIWLIYEDDAAGAVQLRSRTVYVTPENARQLQDILRTEISWL